VLLDRESPLPAMAVASPYSGKTDTGGIPVFLSRSKTWNSIRHRTELVLTLREQHPGGNECYLPQKVRLPAAAAMSMPMFPPRIGRLLEWVANTTSFLLRCR
jgi:hypothetical protein